MFADWKTETKLLSFFYGGCFPPTSRCRRRDMINWNSFKISINLSLGLSRSAGACCDRWKKVVEVVCDSGISLWHQAETFGAWTQQELQAHLRFKSLNPMISFLLALYHMKNGIWWKTLNTWCWKFGTSARKWDIKPALQHTAWSHAWELPV